MFEVHITNGLSHVGLAARYFGYTLLENEQRNRLAIPGFIRKSEVLEKELIHYYLPFGNSQFKYKDVIV